MNSNRLTDLVYFRDAGLKSFYKFVIPLISSKWLCFHCLVPITRSMTALDIVPKINGYKNLKNGYSTLGCVGQSGLQRKKIQAAISMLLLRSVFYVFKAKFFFDFFRNIF